MKKELSQAFINFLTGFEVSAMPNINSGKRFTLKISTAMASDPQVREVIGWSQGGRKECKFLGIPIEIVTDLNVQIYG